MLPYINPLRASPALAVRENDRIVLANTEGRRQTAVFLTTGVVSECNLVTPAYFGNTTTYMGRRICIYPFHTEYQRAVAYIGNTLKHRQSYLGLLFNGTLSFSTRKDVGSGSSVMSPSTPMHPGHSALQFRRQGNHGSNHPVSHPVTNPLPRTHASRMFNISPLVTPHVDKDTLYPTSCQTHVL
jgi:hypothetical protein